MGQQILLGSNIHKLGTCEIAQTFGTVKSATLKDSCEKTIFEDCCDDAALVMLHKEVLELTLEVLWTSTAAVPARGNQITFPVANILGNIENIETKWGSGDKKMLSITASHWKSIGNVEAVTQACA
jgi:hypothetical protein